MWWLFARILPVLGLAMYVTSALGVLSFSPLVIGRQEDARDDAVQEVLARHPAPAPPGDDHASLTIQLRAGEHPGVAQFTIPVPPDARIPLTSIPGGESATPSRDRTLLATSGEVSDVLAFYRNELARNELATRGWHEVRTWMSRPTNGVPGP